MTTYNVHSNLGRALRAILAFLRDPFGRKRREAEEDSICLHHDSRDF